MIRKNSATEGVSPPVVSVYIHPASRIFLFFSRSLPDPYSMLSHVLACCSLCLLPITPAANMFAPMDATVVHPLCSVNAHTTKGIKRTFLTIFSSSSMVRTKSGTVTNLTIQIYCKNAT